MKAICFYSILIFSTCFGSITVTSQPISNPTAESISFLRKFRQDHIKSVLSKTPILLESYYADSMRLMPPSQKTIAGKNTTTAYHQAFIDRFIIHDFSKNEVEILDLNKQLVEIGTLAVRLTSKASRKEYRLRGKYMDLWNKRSEGDPLLLTEIWNYDEYYGDIHSELKFEEIHSTHQAMLPNVPVTNSIRFELAAYNRLLDATVTQHDAATWALYYSDDAIMMSSYHPMFKGKNAIRDYIESHVKELPVFEELDIRNDRVDDLGTFVVEYASHIASWKNGGSSGVSLGKNIRIWRREADHSLKLFRTIGNYD